MNDNLIFPHERVDDLQLQGLKLIQNPSGFCFGVDAVLLADYASKTIKKNVHVLDLCTGSGIIPILLSAKTQAEKIIGVEIQKTVAQMASRSVKLNGLENKISIYCDDLKNAAEHFGRSSFQYITCNPPYKKLGSGILNQADETTIARHEILCSLDDIIRVSSIILKPLGKLCLIHRPDRLVDIITAMKHYGIEPKRLRFVHPYPYKTASMILIEGTRQGKPQLFLDPPLYIYEKPGIYSQEIHAIYGREELQL
ncbi:tRNA1(Val) (adenine(37)-N6)-methyltransferase [Ructibacterium gallinarum]|uniref:tRNA1(Val) (Adenine(37)-N6)-methyltransferase n=1 Tax=Ructibacterium gallinarum TaxID=2779355 RepID=A0A9D5LXI2_9FIRM|nr:tRNA1(Val) (adenine(37)-N6)-methyltransferase [Ructibacterium gallinarum]MBE5039693.1 tRNA1(Val) (adenine(37)-N6)-methyltransferase [Ructibacterium gallinarum]